MGQRRANRALVAGVGLALAWCVPAGADVYWASERGGTIGRATAAGTRIDRAFVRGAVRPRAVAVDGRHVYWAHGGASGRIGRARADGSRPDHGFLSVGAWPAGVTLDAAGLYWTHRLLGAGRVGRAARDGSRPTPAFLSTGPSPCGVAVDSDKVYWGNAGRPGSLGRSHGRFDAEQGFVRRAGDPCGVAVTETHVYWASRAGNAIGRVRLDGTRLERRFIRTFRPCGVAVNASHVFWSTGRGTIARATRGGGRVDQVLVAGARGACGVAVEATVRARPRAHRFRPAPRGRPGAIKAFFLQNTSSSPLDVRRLRIAGAHRRDFAITGESCTPDLVPAGGGCVFNVRFSPTAAGPRRARVAVAASASNAPLAIPLTGRGTGSR